MPKKTRSPAVATGHDPFKAQLSDYMRALGQKGGKASGARRMANISPEQRREIAAVAAKARWKRAKEAKPNP